MKEQLSILIKLQQAEKKKQALLQQKSGFDPGEVRRLWQDLKELGLNIATAKGRMSELEKTCQLQEGEIAEINRHCKALEAKLYGGEITNLKELEQIKNSCDNFRNDITVRENAVLANMEECERLTARIVADESQLQQKKKLHGEKQLQISRHLADFEAKLAEAEGECRELTAGVESQLLAKYRELGRRTAMPVVSMENGVCGGCRISVPVNQLTKKGEEIIFCDNCGRILLVE